MELEPREKVMSQTLFSHISINSSMIFIFSMATKQSWKDLLINTSHVSRQSILAEISGKSTGNHHGTIYQIANILETTMIDTSVLDLAKALFIMLWISLEQPQGN